MPHPHRPLLVAVLPALLSAAACSGVAAPQHATTPASASASASAPQPKAAGHSR